ncbi:MAG: 2Fe-2S iron-sulfur cluster-binding protein [Betaproteobacteria bacterium]
MPKITYVLVDGSRSEIEAATGASVMETAIKGNVRGIDAECGGCLSCATCHVYVDEEWATRLPAPEPDELDMLGFTAAERKPTSRLSCQVRLDASLDGIVVHIPPKQS